jgi:hypothetical protein
VRRHSLVLIELAYRNEELKTDEWKEASTEIRIGAYGVRITDERRA